MAEAKWGTHFPRIMFENQSQISTAADEIKEMKGVYGNFD